MKKNTGALLLAALALAGCQPMADRYIDSYMERKGPEALRKVSEAMRKGESQRAESEFLAQLKTPRPPIDLADTPVIGSEGAAVTLVVFSDFQCPFCSRAVPMVKQIEKDYPGKVKIAFKHLPLPMHKDAKLAAQAAIAAQKQGKFWEMHDLLFQNQQALGEAAIQGYARKLNLKMSQFTKDLKSAETVAKVEKDMQLAQALGVRGTPTFFINGAKAPNGPPDQFKKYIDIASK